MKDFFKHLKDNIKWKKPSFVDSLGIILNLSKTVEVIKIRQILEILSGKGYPALLIIFSLPFCFPIQIPGFSTPFGIILGLIGLRIAFGRKPWLPDWILDKSFKSHSIEKFVAKTISGVVYMQKLLHPRLLVFTQNPIFHRLNGLLIFFLAILLSLPLPIPFTNLISAIPILCFGLGLLEDDGVAILIGYLLTIICFIYFFIIFLFGALEIKHLFS